MLKVVQEENESGQDVAACGGSLLDAIVRDGARQMLLPLAEIPQSC